MSSCRGWQVSLRYPDESSGQTVFMSLHESISAATIHSLRVNDLILLEMVIQKHTQGGKRTGLLGQTGLARILYTYLLINP